MPQKTKRRRHQSYTATTSYRSFRRKAKTPLSSASNTSTRVADKSDSSSDYDDEEIEVRNGNVPAPAPVVDIPSTSSGITANGYLFRHAVTTYDSDDDDQSSSIPETNHQSDTNNLLRVIRSPINQPNVNPHYEFEVNEGASTSNQFRNNFSTIRHHHLHHHHHHNHHENGRKRYRQQDDEHESYASTNNSNSLLSSTSAESSSNEDSNPDLASKKRKLNNGSSWVYKKIDNSINNGASTSTSNGHAGTPIKSTPNTVDSGIAPSSSSSSRNNSNNGHRSLENMKKIEAVKRNYRKNMQTSDDSD